MGCFCRHFTLPAPPALDVSLLAQVGALQTPVVPALSAWLSARWLPAPMPWAPDPAWLQISLPSVSLSATAVATMVGLVNARASLIAAFGLDPAIPAQQAQIARIVATLNLRLPSLAPIALDWQPWSALALLNGQLDTIQAAITAGSFSPANASFNASLALSAQSPALPAWRLLLRQLLALQPLIAVSQSLGVDLSAPSASAALTATIRELRMVMLPSLAMPHVVMQLIARANAIARLQASFGKLPFPAMLAQIRAKLTATLALLRPALPALSLSANLTLEGVPNLLPNPGLVINAATMAASASINASVVAALNWSVSAELAASLSLLTVGAPLAALSLELAATLEGGTGPVNLFPCDQGCDATRAMAELTAAASA